MSKFDLIHLYQTLIIKYIFDYLRQSNVIAIIVTGSAARNQAKFELINGKLCLVSDIDVLIVVRTKGLIRCLTTVKNLSNIITNNLKKFGLRSHVSLSIMTKNSLATAAPSIFMFDLINNGNIIYKNKEIEITFPKFSINDIPMSDVYRLLFNRMVEALRSFVFNCISTSFNETRNPRVLNSFEKLTLSIIQSLFLKRQRLILSSEDRLLMEEGPRISEQDPLLFRCLHIHREIKALKVRPTVTRLEIENIWIQLSGEFKLVVETLGFDHNNRLKFDLMFTRESLSQKIVACILLLLQYYSVSSFSDLIRTIMFETRFGSDHLYFIMYRLFLSSKKFTLVARRDFSMQDLDIIYNNSDQWFSSFKTHMIIWKHKTGA